MKSPKTKKRRKKSKPARTAEGDGSEGEAIAQPSEQPHLHQHDSKHVLPGTRPTSEHVSQQGEAEEAADNQVSQLLQGMDVSGSQGTPSEASPVTPQSPNAGLQLLQKGDEQHATSAAVATPGEQSDITGEPQGKQHATDVQVAATGSHQLSVMELAEQTVERNHAAAEAAQTAKMQKVLSRKEKTALSKAAKLAESVRNQQQLQVMSSGNVQGTRRTPSAQTCRPQLRSRSCCAHRRGADAVRPGCVLHCLVFCSRHGRYSGHGRALRAIAWSQEVLHRCIAASGLCLHSTVAGGLWAVLVGGAASSASDSAQRSALLRPPGAPCWVLRPCTQRVRCRPTAAPSWQQHRAVNAATTTTGRRTCPASEERRGAVST
jgi:hypothetical protein